MKIDTNDIWVYERENGDCGIVIAETYGNALDELRKVYTDIDERLDRGWCRKNGFTWGMNILGIDEIERKANGKVLITTPY